MSRRKSWDPDATEVAVRAMVAAAVMLVCGLAFELPWPIALAVGLVVGFGGWVIVLISEGD